VLVPLHYKNPVWPGYFADPFVLRVDGMYYAYGTGEKLELMRNGETRAFAVLRSRDLAKWEYVGGALLPNAKTVGHAFWAPEVAAINGRYFLYYSSAPAGHDELHRLHVAVSDDPVGPFVWAGPVLPEEAGFCIDAHPFRDPSDGRWYLFYAKDFFEDRTGTGLAVVPLSENMLCACGEPQVILRANADWQIYERNRSHYGKQWAAWHTVEGPCVVVHDGRYYCFYSGGNWQTHDYGVSFAVADHPLGPWRHADESGPLVLRQKPPEVFGPGHNSYTVAPDGRTELLVYHAWDAERTARRMCIDPLIWTDAGPRCDGPTTTEKALEKYQVASSK
jgi:arabinan endo-1,5-alpha-L-arabinosidase